MRTRQAIFFILVGLALWRAAVLIAQPAPPPVLPPILSHHTEMAQTSWLLGEVVSVTRHGSQSLRFAFQVRALSVGPDWRRGLTRIPEQPKVWLTWRLDEGRQAQVDLHAGELWLLPVRWRAARALQREGDFDTWRWMQQQGLSGLGWVMGQGATPWGARRLGTGQSLMQATRERVRDRMAQVIDQPRWAGLVAALSMGDQNAIDPPDWEIFRRTGVAHLVSISGMHVTLLAVWLATLVDACWRRAAWGHRACALYVPAPVVAAWVALSGACVYAVFSGWGLPAQRTVWMLLAIRVLSMAGWIWPPHATWLALVGTVAAFDPLALSQPGFWLSYVAVGVLYGMQGQHHPNPWRRWWMETVDMQWRITLALTPLSLLFFQGVSLAGLWVNLFAIPWVTLVVTPLSLLGMVWPPLWHLAAWACGWLLWGLEWAAASPWALVEMSRPSIGITVVTTLLAVRAVWPGPLLWRSLCTLCVGLLLGGHWCVAGTVPNPHASVPVHLVHDVGQCLFHLIDQDQAQIA
ncbi:MAG: ComEC/Rec2 family competence protein [Alphaproteobacteria bacterium]|nr:ComEC/Rec2 family competence protein [Alphaproteobacteria bacterium]